MSIRRATPDDSLAIARIHVETWQVAYRGVLPDDHLRALSIERREAHWRQALSAEPRESEVWVAEDEGQLVGWISAGKSRDPDGDAATAEVWAIYVDPMAWRRGVGRALWREAEAHFTSARFSRVTLWVLRENERALRFYAAIGFTEDPGQVKTFERAGVELIEIRLAREITASGLASGG